LQTDTYRADTMHCALFPPSKHYLPHPVHAVTGVAGNNTKICYILVWTESISPR